MEKSNPQGANRRDVLKSIGVGAVGLATIPSVTQATGESRERILDWELVDNALSELNNPEVQEVTQRSGNIGDENRAVKLTSTEVDTEIGRLLHSNFDDGPEFVQFTVEENSDQDVSSHQVPDRYAGATEYGEGVLMQSRENLGQNPDFIRETTEEETRRVVAATQLSSSDQVLYNTSIGQHGGYEIHTDGSSPRTTDGEDVYFLKPRREIVSPSDLTEDDLSEAKVNTMAADDTFEVQLNDCETWVGTCLTAVTPCIACAVSCASVGVGNIPGAVACIACMYTCSFVLPLSCSLAVENCT